MLASVKPGDLKQVLPALDALYVRYCVSLSALWLLATVRRHVHSEEPKQGSVTCRDTAFANSDTEQCSSRARHVSFSR